MMGVIDMVLTVCLWTLAALAVVYFFAWCWVKCYTAYVPYKMKHKPGYSEWWTKQGITYRYPSIKECLIDGRPAEYKKAAWGPFAMVGLTASMSGKLFHLLDQSVTNLVSAGDIDGEDVASLVVDGIAAHEEEAPSTPQRVALTSVDREEYA